MMGSPYAGSPYGGYAGGGYGQRRLGGRRMAGYGGGSVTLVIIVISLIAYLVRPSSPSCTVFCGPATGSSASLQTYTNSKWGFSIAYDSSEMSVQSQDADSVTLTTPQGEIVVSASANTTVQQAIASGVAMFPSSHYQRAQEVGTIPGAEIGLVPGQGVAYTASYAQSAFSLGSPSAFAVIAATHGSTTLQAAMVSSYTSDDPPFGLTDAPLFDFALTHLQFTR